MNVKLDIIWTMPVQLRETQNKWTLQKIYMHDRIRTTNTAQPPDYKSTVIATRPQLAWYEMELSVNEMFIYMIYNRSVWTCSHTLHRINMVYMSIAVAAVQWYNICIVLQIDVDILSLFLSIFICYKRNVRQPTHCWCDILAPTRCSLTWYNICIVLKIDQCIYCITVLNNIHTL